jgi:hypothetical protein
MVNQQMLVGKKWVLPYLMLSTFGLFCSVFYDFIPTCCFLSAN